MAEQVSAPPQAIVDFTIQQMMIYQQFGVPVLLSRSLKKVMDSYIVKKVATIIIIQKKFVIIFTFMNQASSL